VGRGLSGVQLPQESAVRHQQTIWSEISLWMTKQRFCKVLYVLRMISAAEILKILVCMPADLTPKHKYSTADW